ncbi:MAG TPA: ATP-binding protein [Pseudonocardiaceae bacterium]|jgi:signal transduction histidine kinase|nr:ATP-binding protein [Pseudonocardiaceae bacterium]
MPSVEPPAPPANFLVSLLRRGAPVIADIPPDLPDAATDPDPVPGWQRISMIATNGQGVSKDSLLVRACRYVVLVPLVYRVLGTPVALLSLLAAGGAGISTVAVATVLLVVANLGGVVWVLRVSGFRRHVAGAFLLADAVLAIAANMVTSGVSTRADYFPAIAMSWNYLLGTMALWTLVWGVPAALLLWLASFPLQILMAYLSGFQGLSESLLMGALGRSLSGLAAIATALVGLMLVGIGTRLALGVGIRRGRAAEHARIDRDLHDGVLQVLEAMALPVPVDADSAQTQLRELRGLARAQAMELRRALDRPSDAAPSVLGEDLAGLAAEMTREGLRAQLVFADVDDGELSEARRIAVRDAVREALRNTMKHAGTGEVVVRVEQRDSDVADSQHGARPLRGIAVIARDHGTGFDAQQAPAGFGITNSITARLVEVGGSAKIESAPGKGTRVTLWVPL